MSREVELLRAVEESGGRIYLDDGRVKFKSVPKAITEEMREHKPKITALLQGEKVLMDRGFMTLERWWCYEKRLTTNSSLFIFGEEDGTFTAWRGSWRPNESKPYSEKTLAEGVPLYVTLERVVGYLDWRKIA
jgi:hypothetical protein